MKAVLVIEMPNSCNECPLRYFKQGDYCCVTKALIEDGINCPLKPMPKRRLEWDWGIGAHDWNACLDEILGETE